MLRRYQSAIAWLALWLAHSPIQASGQPVQTEESWEAVFISDTKVGYAHTVVRPVTEDGQSLVHVQIESVMTIKRFGQTIEMTSEFNSYETLAGKVLRMNNRTRASMLEMRMSGKLVGNQMQLTLETPFKKTTQSIPWDDDMLGPNAEDRILKEERIKPGQRRSFRTFVPDLNVIATASLIGEEQEEVKLLDGTKRRLQRVRVEMKTAGRVLMKSIAWVDDKGEALKTHTDMLGGITTYQVTKEVAQARPSVFAKDFGLATLIRPQKRIPNPYRTTEVVYRIELNGEDPKEIFPQDQLQRLTMGSNGEVLLTVRWSDVPPELPSSNPKVDPEYLRSNNYLQTDHPKVISAAQQAVGDATDPWKKAQRIESWVYEHMTEKNFSVGFATAAEVAENLEGDCTEHGVLLAAMARAVGIPSRVVVGLIYADRLGAFGYHMWAEVFVAGRWVPLDGTLGLGHASPAHIKLAAHSMDGVDAMAAFLPVALVLDRLKIEVVSWKHAD